MPTNIEKQFTREIAGFERETAEARTFSEEEHVAILASTVSRETAGLTTANEGLTAKVTSLETKVAQLETEKAEVAATAVTDAATELTAREAEKAELQNKLDVEVAARETAEKALTDRNAEIDHEREVASRQEARIAGVRTALPHKADEWFTAERASRWALMDQDAFDGYVAELAEVTAGLDKAPVTTSGAPRETAMKGAAATTTAAKPTSAFFEQNRKGI